MSTWPDIETPTDLKQKLYKPQIKTEFENGAVQSRPRGTRARYRWELSWERLPDADYQALESFFVTNQGGTFTWLHPIRLAYYTVRFVDDDLGGDPIHPPWQWNLTVRIEEA